MQEEKHLSVFRAARVPGCYSPRHGPRAHPRARSGPALTAPASAPWILRTPPWGGNGGSRMASHPLRGPRPTCGTWLVPSVPTCNLSQGAGAASPPPAAERAPFPAWIGRPARGVNDRTLELRVLSFASRVSLVPVPCPRPRHMEDGETFRGARPAHVPAQAQAAGLSASSRGPSGHKRARRTAGSGGLLLPARGMPSLGWKSPGSPAGPTSWPGKSPSTWPTAGRVASAQPCVLQAAVRTQIQSVAASKSARMKGMEGVTAHQRLQAGLCV